MIKKPRKAARKKIPQSLHKFPVQPVHHKVYKKISAKIIGSYVLVAYGLIALTIIYFSFLSYDSYLNRKRLEMEAAAYEIEMNFTNTLSYAESVLNFMNRQIAASKSSNDKIAEILASFNHSYYGYNSIKDVISAGMFYWIDGNRNLVASSAGVIQSPIDLSSRSYLVNTQKDPWRIYTGTPVIGASSGQYVIPAAVGVLDNNGEYIGTSVVSFKVFGLLEKFKNLIDYYGSEFAILDENNKVLMESEIGLFSEDNDLLNNLKLSNQSLHQEMVSDFSLFKNRNYVIVRNIEKYPYKILIGNKNSVLSGEVLFELLPHLIELIILTIFFATMMVLVRNAKRS